MIPLGVPVMSIAVCMPLDYWICCVLLSVMSTSTCLSGVMSTYGLHVSNVRSMLTLMLWITGASLDSSLLITLMHLRDCACPLL